jgi:hypothetical protein
MSLTPSSNIVESGIKHHNPNPLHKISNFINLQKNQHDLQSLHKLFKLQQCSVYKRVVIDLKTHI